MKKILSIILVLVLVLTACSGGSTSSGGPVEITEPVTVTYWHAMQGAQEEILTQLTDAYNASQDNVTVELVNQGDYGTLQQKITQAGEAGELPTMAQGYSNWMADYLTNDWLVNLQAYFDSSDYGLDSSVYVDAFIEEVNFDGSYYAVPFNKSTEVLYYNKELAEKAGVTDVSSSFDAMVEASKKITEETGVVAVGYDSLSNYLAVAIKECGIDEWFDEDGKAQFNDQCVIDKVEAYQTGIREGYMRVAGEDGYLSTPFGNGDLAMNVGSTAGATYVDAGVAGKFEWSVAAYPGDIAVQQGTSLMAFNSATEMEISGAWDYMKYVTSDESTLTWANGTGYLPVTKAAYDSEEYQKQMESNQTAKISAEQVDKMEVVVPVFPGSNEIYSTAFMDYMSAVLEADKDATSEMETLVSTAEDIYARNN